MCREAATEYGKEESDGGADGRRGKRMGGVKNIFSLSFFLVVVFFCLSFSSVMGGAELAQGRVHQSAPLSRLHTNLPGDCL